MDEMDESNGHSKSPLQSKKFVAFLISEVLWKAVLLLVLFWGKDAIPHQVWAIMIAVILVAGFVEALYIGGQAALDRYIQVAQIAANAGQDVVMKGVTLSKGATTTPLKNNDDTEKPG